MFDIASPARLSVQQCVWRGGEGYISVTQGPPLYPPDHRGESNVCKGREGNSTIHDRGCISTEMAFDYRQTYVKRGEANPGAVEKVSAGGWD
jgi:hypothetical protein